MLLAAPAVTWHEAVEKTRYLLMLFAVSPGAQDPLRKQLIEDVLADFDRLSNDSCRRLVSGEFTRQTGSV